MNLLGFELLGGWKLEHHGAGFNAIVAATTTLQFTGACTCQLVDRVCTVVHYANPLFTITNYVD